MTVYQSLIDELNEFAETAPPFTPKPSNNPFEKWLLRSALQKSIRRGRVDKALEYGERLYGLEADYAWYSMSIIVPEDVGLGDPDLLAYSTVNTLKTVTSKAQPKKLFAAQVARAAACPIKTRSNTELTLLADASEKEFRALASKAPVEELTEEMFGGEYAPAAAIAASVLRKRCGADKTLMHGILNRMLLEAPNETLARAAMMSFERFSDPINISTYPLVRAMYGTKALPSDVVYEARPDVMPEEIEVKGITCAAYDMHVSTGKKAIKAFCTSLSKRIPLVAEFANKTEDVVKALGCLIFFIEGGQVDLRMWSDELQILKDTQDRVVSVDYGVPDEMYEELFKIVAENIDVLNQKRLWAANL